MKPHTLVLRALGAGRDLVRYSDAYEDANQMYTACTRPDWLLWLAGKARRLDRVTAVRIGIACAEPVVYLVDQTNFEVSTHDLLGTLRAWTTVPWHKHSMAKHKATEIVRLHAERLRREVDAAICASGGFIGRGEMAAGALLAVSQAATACRDSAARLAITSKALRGLHEAGTSALSPDSTVQCDAIRSVVGDRLVTKTPPPSVLIEHGRPLE